MGMDKISGQHLEKLPYPNMRKIADLTYLDGPLLSLFRDFSNQNYLFYWYDVDETCNRWLVFPISAHQLSGYLTKTVALLELINTAINAEIFVVDIDIMGNHLAVLHTQPAALPSSTLPQRTSYFEPTLCIVYEQAFCGESFTIFLEEIQRLQQKRRSFNIQPIDTVPYILNPTQKDSWVNPVAAKHDASLYPSEMIPKSRQFRSSPVYKS